MTTQNPPLSPVRETEIAALREGAIVGEEASVDAIVHAAANKRFVLLGEATHGTHEFYDLRRRISQRLIAEEGFLGIVVEADWPDAYRVNRYIKGDMRDGKADKALSGFKRFPQWMWRNTVVVELVEWLRAYNKAQDSGPKAGFYGMDLYSLYGSIEAVIDYLQERDPEAAERARERYGCFEPYNGDPQAYGRAASGMSWAGRFSRLLEDCQEEVLQQLVELINRADFARDGTCAEDEHFFAEQNARLVKNAERYYRQMYRGEEDTWNLRDSHMTETLEHLSVHLARTTGRPPEQAKLIVWAHNSHLGDARSTQMGARGEHNVGQLLRERFDDAVFNLGFTTHTGSVTAADNWGEDPRHLAIIPSVRGSVEHLCHDAVSGLDDAVALWLPDDNPAASAAIEVLAEQRLERAIGVIYRPRTERQSHYFEARPAEQFDAILHVDETRALRPLELHAGYDPDHAETYPSGL